MNKIKCDYILTILLSIYCVLLPFEEILVFSFGSLNKVVGILAIAYIFFAYKEKLRISAFYFPLILWLVYMLMSMLWSSSFSWWSYFFKIYCVQVLFTVSIDVVPNGRISISFIKKSLITAGLIAACILLFLPTSSSFTEEGRRTIMLFGNTFDPNIVGSIMLFSAFVAIEGLYTSPSRKRFFLYLSIMGFLLLGILYTGSRGSLLSFVVGFVVLNLLKFKDKKFRNKSIAFALLGIAVFAIAFLALPENLINSRFSVSTIFGFNEYQSGSHNRYTIWLYSLQLIKEQPIFGCGCGNFFSSIATVYRETACHNLYILLFVEGGFVGFVLFMVFIINVMTSLIREKDYPTFSLLVAILFMALTLDTLSFKYFWTSLIFCRLMIVNKESIGPTRTIRRNNQVSERLVIFER